MDKTKKAPVKGTVKGKETPTTPTTPIVPVEIPTPERKKRKVKKLTNAVTLDKLAFKRQLVEDGDVTDQDDWHDVEFAFNEKGHILTPHYITLTASYLDSEENNIDVTVHTDKDRLNWMGIRDADLYSLKGVKVELINLSFVESGEDLPFTIKGKTVQLETQDGEGRWFADNFREAN